MSAVKGYDMTRYWRLVSVQGIVSGTFWVTRPNEKRRGQIYVHTVDVNIWDEDRRFGRCLTTKDVTAGTAVANRVELWIDCRDPANVKLYVDAVRVLSATTFRLDNAAGPLGLLAHLEKTAGTATAGPVWLDRAEMRTAEQ